MTTSPDDIERLLGLGEHRKRFAWRRWYAVPLVLLGVALWYGLGGHDPDKGVRYGTATATRGNFTVTVNATGTVEPTNLVEISSELSGTLATVDVDYNDTVEVGTVLATLDTTTLEAEVAVSRAQLDAAAARVAMAEATLEDAREKYDSLIDLDRRALAAHQDLVTRRAAYARARAELESAVADRHLAEANLALREAELDKACICSPIAGIVLERAVDPGQIVAASFSAPVMFTLAEDLAEMELQIDIDEADIGRVDIGDAVTFAVDAHDERRFPTTIASIRYASETIDGVVTYKAILSVDNEALLLRPGMTATADITVADVEGALIVPNAALRYAPPAAATEADDEEERSGLLGMLIPDHAAVEPSSDEGTLWVWRDGQAVEVPIEAGETNGEVTEIRGGDVIEGDAVIVERIDG